MVGGSALLSHGRIECPGEHLVGIFAVPGIERIQCYVPFCLNVEYLEIILSGACQLQGVVFQVGDSRSMNRASSSRVTGVRRNFAAKSPFIEVKAFSSRLSA